MKISLFCQIKFLNLDDMTASFLFSSILLLFRCGSYARKWISFIHCNPIPVVKNKFFFKIFFNNVMTNIFLTLPIILIKGVSLFLLSLITKKIQQLPFMWWNFQKKIISFESQIIFLKVFKKNPHVCPCFNVHCSILKNMLYNPFATV